VYDLHPWLWRCTARFRFTSLPFARADPHYHATAWVSIRSISQKQINTVAVNASGEWLAFGTGTMGQLLVWEWQSET